MVLFRPLPWEYGVRNLFRRPLRSALTLAALTVVVLLVLIVLGFIRGLERSLEVSGDPRVALVFSLGMGENLEYSSVPMRTADLVSANIEGIQQRYGEKYASPELYAGTQVRLGGNGRPAMGLVRGVTPAALLVHGQVEIVEGRWPRSGEVLVGRLAGTKLGAGPGRLQVGGAIELEGRRWQISGIHAAAGSTYESEIWCRLDELQQAMKRQDLSLVALTLGQEGEFQDVDLFCKERLDLELQALRQSEYFAKLQEDYAPVRKLAWLVVALVFAAGVFVGLNTMYGAVVGRIREAGTLQTIGFARRAAVLSLVQEGTLLAMAAALVASFLAFAFVEGTAVRFTMGAFELRLDEGVLLAGYATALGLGVLGSLPPALRIVRTEVVDALKSV